MTEQRPNPTGLEGFEFVEYASPEPEKLHSLFKRMGFVPVARHKSMAITLYRQGDVNFLLNEEPGSFAMQFAEEHGPCCPGFALRVSDAPAAYEHVISSGAETFDQDDDTAVDCPRIKGIGGSMLYLCDRKNGRTIFDSEFEFEDENNKHPEGFGLTFVDHLTHNVYEGNMDEWADFYTRLFGFFEVKYFDIKGAKTGLRSRAMTAPTGDISIPINESSDPTSQINEYLDEYDGEGVQHVALYTENIYETIEQMRDEDVSFLDTPDTYFDVIDTRIPNHGEDVERMRKNKILIDADHHNQDLQLLQIFTETNIGPLFFEIIQRKGNKGFGEGNFQALFEAIERDQEKRGVL